MKNLLFIFGLFTLSMSSQAKEWYEEKGTLHDATLKEWCKAEAKNKLVTAGDFVAAIYQKKLLKPDLIKAIDEQRIQGMKIMANELVEGLDYSACNGKKELDKNKVSSTASMLMLLMGWIGE
ncbi:hypothetical protein [Rodentibacter caecimuris]|uniref:Uncharacterized protein n=1 Tax=Rodentibacter caecimuris TaxID=1796644 RepID=A0ABX3KY14_9PAST|nr:hypothetical protein BKG89_06440 [Rodentibacter heylii]